MPFTIATSDTISHGVTLRSALHWLEDTNADFFQNRPQFLATKMIFKPTKDKIPKEQSSNIVYSVPCKGIDCKAVYIGQTKRFLKNRLKEHKNNIKETPNKQNALTKHTVEKDHFFEFHRTKILANEHNYKKRLLLEMCRIAGTVDAVNLRTDIENLFKFYNPIIKKVP